MILLIILSVVAIIKLCCKLETKNNLIKKLNFIIGEYEETIERQKQISKKVRTKNE